MAKVILVTGGSRGIGAACCRLAATHGYDVAVNYAGNAAGSRHGRGRRAGSWPTRDRAQGRHRR